MISKLNNVSEIPKTIGLVLAGGRSSRMGTDKALLTIEQSTMIERTVQVLSDTCVQKVLISRNDNLPQHIADIIPNKGPLSGIHSIVTQFPEYNVVVLPVDLPFIDASTIDALITCGRQNTINVRYCGHNLPLYIHNSISFRHTLEYTLTKSRCYSVGRFCDQFLKVELADNTHSTMFNTNTPEQWRDAIQQFAESAPTGPKETLSESFE